MSGIETGDHARAIGRWEDRRQLKNLMGKYANLLILNRDGEIYGMLWSESRSDTAFGVNEGWYAGADSVKNYYAARCAKNRAVAGLLAQRFPDKTDGRSGDELYGIGVFRSMPVSCPVIKIAGDGRTARGLWMCYGGSADLYPYGPSARWIWGYYAVDFIREDGGWRIWHMKWLEELVAKCGENWGRPKAAPPVLPEFAEIADFAAPEPDVRETLYTAWTPTRPPLSMEIPGDYESFSASDAYAPDSLRPADGEIIGVLPREGAWANAGADGGVLTEEDILTLRQILDREAVIELMNRRVHYVFAGKRAEELADLWVRGGDARSRASYGKNWGWYRGFDAIEDYYVKKFDARLDAQKEANGAAERGAGNLYAHPITTPYVEIAADGRSARGLWYSIAQETWASANGADALWMLEKIAVDFLKEDDGWRILNMMTAVDLGSGAGEDYAKQPVYLRPEDDPVRIEFGEPTVPQLAHDNMFNWWDNYPPIPEPYESFSWGNSYGPDGWQPPKLKGFSAGEGGNYR
jgi:hypothetical protein